MFPVLHSDLRDAYSLDNLDPHPPYIRSFFQKLKNISFQVLSSLQCAEA